MNAERLGTHKDVFSGRGDYFAFVQQAANPFDDKVGLRQQCIRLSTWNKCSVITVAAVGKSLFPQDQSGTARNTGNASAGARVDLGLRPEASDGGDVAFGQGFVFFTGVIKSTVEFDVVKPDAVRLRDAFQRADLMQQQKLEFVRRKSHRAAPKITPAPRTRMGPQPHAMLPGKSDTGFHGLQIPAVSAASYVGRRDATHKGPSALERLAFAQITIEVQFHERSWNRTLTPGRH